MSLFDSAHFQAKSAEELIQHYKQVRSRLVKKAKPEPQWDEMVVPKNLSEHETVKIFFCEGDDCIPRHESGTGAARSERVRSRSARQRSD